MPLTTTGGPSALVKLTSTETRLAEASFDKVERSTLACEKQELEAFITWQQDQFEHDRKSHTDILYLHKLERLKHYGLHFAKYVGRLAKGPESDIPLEQTLLDTLLISLSSANALSLMLRRAPIKRRDSLTIDFACAVGDYCDAVEKFDHFEEALEKLKTANLEIFSISLEEAERLRLNVPARLQSRRNELRKRAFFVPDEL